MTSARRKYLAVSWKCTAAAETQRATMRLAKPGTTFGSKARVGIPFITAANMAGPEAYPPTPITTSGWNSESICRAAQTARGNPSKVFSRVARLTRFSAPTSISRSSKPVRGNQAVLNAPRRPDKQDFRAIGFLQFMGDGERGNNVSAGPAPRQNGSHALTINQVRGRKVLVQEIVCSRMQPMGRGVALSSGARLDSRGRLPYAVLEDHSACLLTFSRTPTHASVMNNDDPP